VGLGLRMHGDLVSKNDSTRDKVAAYEIRRLARLTTKL
jgi:hypothetical protein